jgi:acyl-coenzyme A synthetase/AMP-(fatty) acid ligase
MVVVTDLNGVTAKETAQSSVPSGSRPTSPRASRSTRWSGRSTGSSAGSTCWSTTLYEHPDVAAVAVVGLPDPRLQERACAVVVLKSGVGGFTMDDMRAFLTEKGVARQYWPERLELFPELPRTASGKIRKVELREMLGGGS